MTLDLREALAALLPEGFDLEEQPGFYEQSAGIFRWRAKDGDRQLIVEHWTKRLLPEQRWYVRVQGVGTLVELAQGVTVEQAVDACVLAGVLPPQMASQYRAGVQGAADAIEAFAESIGWYEGDGVWADAIEKAREVGR